MREVTPGSSGQEKNQEDGSKGRKWYKQYCAGERNARTAKKKREKNGNLKSMHEEKA